MSEQSPDSGRGEAVRQFRRFLLKRLPIASIGLQLLLLVLILFWNRIFIFIEAGQAGVLWNRFYGTQIDRVRGEGLSIISPLDRIYIYEVRKQVVSHDLSVLSIEGLRLELSLAIRFRPRYDLLGMLQERIGPEYLTRVVVPQTESVLRKELGNATAEQIYTNEGGLLTRALVKAMEEIGRNFVEVEDIIIRSIRLPEIVRTAIEHKLVQEQLLLSYQFRRQTAVQEAERKRIMAGGLRDYNQIVDSTLSSQLLSYQGIQATYDLANSENEKTVVVGAADNIAFPIFLGGQNPKSPPAIVPEGGTNPGVEVLER
ncbi:MAG TPA: prohibitin family protein [Chromatiaceae bacterium]|nr:MAG: hypothetical protein N838_33450 [Thiohalocapsa sp. PB-PSB1]QQO52228.1 MAG: prohibitin family protein [Thiohalocapsa sp. PB-PSB1]HBG95169.1 prohibitin family protein [Chromatiaceae bacterium]